MTTRDICIRRERRQFRFMAYLVGRLEQRINLFPDRKVR